MKWERFISCAFFCETAVRMVFVQGICGSLPYADLQESQQGHEND